MIERLDGNAIGGLLYDLFGQEMTVSTGFCRSCGQRARVAELHVYMRAPGTVARCPHCESVLLCIVEGPRGTWIDLGGLSTFHIEH